MMYLLQVSIGIGVAWIIYHVALKGRSAARTNRYSNYSARKIRNIYFLF